MFKKLTKNTTILGLGTLFSRILGLLRDVLIAKYFGTSGILEVFIVAFRAPNLLRSIFGEGFSDSVAVPALSVYSRDKKKLFKISNNLIIIFTLILAVVTLLGIVLSRYIVTLIAPGFISNASKFGIAVSFMKITFPYIFFIGLASNFTAILYAVKRFIGPAIIPSLLNISFILGMLFFRPFMGDFILAGCVIAGGILQFIFSYLFLYRSGFRMHFGVKEAFSDKEVLSMLRRAIPRIWSSIVYQLNVFIDTIFSSLSWIVGTGAMAAIYYSNRIVQFPLALIALSVSRAAIVDFSRFSNDGNTKDFKKLFVFSFQNIMFFIVPVSIVFIFIPQEILRLLFLRGEFDTYSLMVTSSTLFFYSFGLLFFCGIKLLVNTFYALKDTVTPARISTISLIINAALSALLMFPFKAGGIALASSIAAAFNFFLLLRMLTKRIGPIDYNSISKEIFKLVAIGVLLGVVAKIIFIAVPCSIFIQFIAASAADFMLLVILGRIMKLRQAEVLAGWLKTLKKK
ncbi:MAG: murein biosynthesis integral membrane protein MurJ [Candidatus Omnitrophica bacterium 4484_171]|nr:MAG: murein biosynthesis integral membrane protein MurJ [Candidatus Omnitrophica bacterium 4484_171]